MWRHSCTAGNMWEQRDWNETSAGQGMPTDTGNQEHQKQILPEAAERAWSHQHLDFRLTDSEFLLLWAKLTY